MKTISVLEVARILGVAWRTARARILDGTIPGKMRHSVNKRRWAVDRKTFEKWLVSEGISQ